MAFRFFDKNYAVARLCSTKTFWWFHLIFGKLNFSCLRFGFHLKDSAFNLKDDTRYWKAICRNTVKPILVAVLVGIGLWVFERNLSFFVVIPWIRGGIIGKYLLHTLDDGNYVQLLVVIASITGVFLALYFTAVNTVMSNAYSSAPGNVRELLLRDKLGNKYVHLIAFLAALSVILLSLDIGSATPLHLAIPFLAITSCLAIFAFINLGSRTFILTDPTLFFGTISGELLKWVRRSTYRGYQWRNRSFQVYYHKQALNSIITLVDLLRIATGRSELHEKSFPELLNNLLALVNVYSKDKHLIPSESEWYGKKSQYKQWYLSDSISLGAAVQTGTSLQPINIPNTTWLEDTIIDAVLNAIKTDIDVNDYEAASLKMANLPDFFNEVGHQFFTDEGEKWCKQLANDVLAKLTNTESIDRIQEQYSISITDILAATPMSIELGFIKAIRETDATKLRNQITNTKWYRYDAPYHFSLPLETMKTLEQVNRSIMLEKEAHAPNKTPNWYITEQTFQALDMELYRQWQLIAKMIRTWYSKVGEALVKAKKYRHALIIYSRATELSWKLNGHLKQLKRCSENLQVNNTIESIKNVEWDWGKEQKRLDEFRIKAVEGQSNLIPHLWSAVKPDPSMPDFFGEAVQRTGEECYRTLVQQDGKEFKLLFHSYFIGILGIFESVKSQANEMESSAALTRMSDPILDLFDISGYAYIYSEYYEKPELWSECKSVWDTHFNANNDIASQSLEIMATISKYHQCPTFMLSPRSTLRGQRQQELIQLLNPTPKEQKGTFQDRRSTQHPSELIRNITPSYSHNNFMSVDAIDVFTVKYLVTLAAADNFDFGVDTYKIQTINGNHEGHNV